MPETEPLAASALASPTPDQVEAELAGRPDEPAASPPARPGRRAKRKRVDPTPRFLVILFCLWMLGSWFISLRSAGYVRPSQWMVLSSMLAILAFWPVLRLSQWRGDLYDPDNGSADTRRTPGRIFMDWFCLNVLFQTVVWPLQMNAGWRVDQTVWISLTMASWSLIAAAIVALGCLSHRASRRLVAAAGCLLLLAGEPLLVVLIGPLAERWTQGDITFFTSPIALFVELTGLSAQWVDEPWRVQVPLAAIAGVLAWGVVLISSRWMEPSHEPGVLGKRA